jgi:hypothetical protein
VSHHIRRGIAWSCVEGLRSGASGCNRQKKLKEGEVGSGFSGRREREL